MRFVSHHTPKMHTVEVDGMPCEVYQGTDGKVQSVRRVIRTKGDSHNTHRNLRLDGPMAKRAIALALASYPPVQGSQS